MNSVDLDNGWNNLYPLYRNCNLVSSLFNQRIFVAGEGVSAIANGMATAADWMSAASFFPAIVMGIFSKRMNKEGVISGMVVGISLMLFNMMKFKLGFFGGGTLEDWWFGVSPEGFGT